MSYNADEVVKAICEEEGFRPSAYQDSLGYLTIGYGTLIDSKRGGAITHDEALYLLKNRLVAYVSALDTNLPWWRDLSSGRQTALIQMAYQMGWNGLRAFKKMLDAMRVRDFETASDEALNSVWAQQTPSRAHRIAVLIRGNENG